MIEHPAYKGIQRAKIGEALRDPNFCRVVIAVLVARYGSGNPIAISQDDVNAMTGSRLMEGYNLPTNSLLLDIEKPRGVVQ